MAYERVQLEEVHRTLAEAEDDYLEGNRISQKKSSPIWKFSKWLFTQILVTGTLSLFFFLIFRHYLLPTQDSSVSANSLQAPETTLLALDGTPANVELKKGSSLDMTNDVDLRNLDEIILDTPRLKYREFVSGTSNLTFASDIMIPIGRDPFAEEYDTENCLRQMKSDMVCASNETMFYLNEQLTCGGLPLGDICLLPIESKFQKRTERSIDIPKSARGKICQSIEDTMVGHNDKGFWVPSDCSMTNSSPKNLVKNLGGRRMALIGDSHTRNMFEGFVCEIRDSPLCPDAKSPNSIYYYHFNETHDELLFIQNKDMIHEMDFDTSDVHLIFFWMPHWNDLDLDVIGRFNPDIMIISVAGWERTVHDNPTWRASLDQYFLSHDLKKFIFMEWPWGGGEKKKQYILPWMENRPFMEFYSVKALYNIYDNAQTKLTWHTLCKVSEEITIDAFILCTGTVERNQARIMLTSFVASFKKD